MKTEKKNPVKNRSYNDEKRKTKENWCKTKNKRRKTEKKKRKKEKKPVKTRPNPGNVQPQSNTTPSESSQDTVEDNVLHVLGLSEHAALTLPLHLRILSLAIRRFLMAC